MDLPRVTRLEGVPAPAKLNLFLHVTGRRADGYHLLQSAFRLIDRSDRLDFALRRDGRIRRTSALPGVAEEHDLCLRAAHLLQRTSATTLGADITLHKRLPYGGGLGGGSSDAATTLIALNRLWETGLSRSELIELGARLGADVPFFIFGRDAFVEGIGEILQPLPLPPTWYVVVEPGVAVSTAAIFTAPELTRETKPLRIADFAFGATRNDLQTVVCARHPEVAAAVEWLGHHASARMTGSGACVFAPVPTEAAAAALSRDCPPKWKAWYARSLEQHPLHGWID